jgi:malonyl-CoA O-methyltransferase
LKTLFECWRRVGSSLPLFKFPKEEEVFKKFSSLFQVIEFERLILKREFRSPREAVKAVTGVGAKNPFGRPKKGELLKFLEIYSKEPIVEYRVLIISGRKV